ncbi:hypothetical protein D047_2882, partial [Vibrio parahaemolyticus VPTS-2010_2]
MIRPPLTV